MDRHAREILLLISQDIEDRYWMLLTLRKRNFYSFLPSQR